VRLLIQRVSRASVSVGNAEVARIGPGLLALVGIGHGDTESIAASMAGKVVGLRIFRDDAGLTNRSLLDVDGEFLAVSQFTLFGDTRRGRRPSFIGAAPPALAEHLVEHFARSIEAHGPRVARGIFGAEMAVESVNDGPMTIWLDSASG
jgi:D-tyrosyl-tRNA(Tyr) deacylase